MENNLIDIKKIVDLYVEATIISDFEGNIIHLNPAFANMCFIFPQKPASIDDLMRAINSTDLADAYRNWIFSITKPNINIQDFNFTSGQDNTSVSYKATVCGKLIINIISTQKPISTNIDLWGNQMIPIAICRLDTLGIITHCNKAFCELVALKNSEDIIGKDMSDFFDTPWNKFDLSRFQKLLKEGRISGDEKNIITSNGEIKHIELLCNLDSSNDGIFGILVYIIETTSTRRKLSVLEAKEKTTKNLISKTSNESGTVFFEKAVLALNNILNCEFSFIGKNSETENQMEILAGANNDKLIPKFIHLIRDSPCEEIENKKISLHINNAYMRFPNDPFITTNKIRGYIGLPLINPNGKLIGAIACASSKPLTNIPLAELLMQILSSRIIGEIEKGELFNQIKKSELKFRTIFETNPYPILITDASDVYRILDVNTEFIKTTGLTRNDILSKNLQDLNIVHPKTNVQNIISEIKKAGNLYRAEIQAKNHSGEYRYCETVSILTRLNETNCIVTYIIDVHEQKMSNLRLLESEEIFRSLFNNASDPILTIRQDYTIIDCNQAAQILYDCSREEIIGKNPIDFSPEKQPDGKKSTMLINRYSKRALAGSTQRFEWIQRRKNGEQIITDVSLSRYIFKGQPYIQAFIREMTEQKKIQSEIYNAVVKAEEEERMRFARELHDGISPILSTVKLYSQSFINSNNVDFQKELSKRIESTTNEAIISLSEISNKLSPHVLKNFGLVEAIKSFSNNIQQATHIKIQFDSNLKERIPENIEITFYRTLTELINNTVKHAKASTIDIQLVKGQNLMLFYSDNGIGLGKNDNNKGMGIFNIKNRIQSLGGSFEISNKPSKGFSVTIKAPLKNNYKSK